MERRLCRQERAVEHDGGHAFPFIKGDFVEGGLGADRRVVDHHVDAAEVFDCFRDELRNLFRIGDIGDVKRGLAAGLLDHRYGFLAFSARSVGVDHHRGTARCERQRNAAADVARAAGDQRDLAGEFVAGPHPWSRIH